MKKKIFTQDKCTDQVSRLLNPNFQKIIHKKDYIINSPYADVIWSGDNAWKQYKGNLHTHSTISDATVDNKSMILAYYNHGYDFLAMTDHGVTGKEWDKKPNAIPLYLYQHFIGNKTTKLSEEEYSDVKSGKFPVNGIPRGYGMTCVPGGNELNALTITKDHVNAIFLPSKAGNNYLGYENDYEGAVRLANHYGAISFINHPGDWLNSNKNRYNVHNPEKIAYFADILLRYESCLGTEVFNEHNGTTGYDRETWDNLLMACLPYGKNIIGFSNGDTHSLKEVDSSFCVYMMQDNNLENIRETMKNGASFAVTRVIRKDTEKFGPDEDLDERDCNISYPTFNNIHVKGHKISVSYSDTYNIKWIANGKIILDENISDSQINTTEINLDDIEGNDEFLYIRCQIIGKGGITLTQAFPITDDTKPLIYKRNNSLNSIFKRIVRQFLGTRNVVIIKTLFDSIKK